MEQFNKSETTYFYVIGLSYKKADAKIRGEFSLDQNAKANLMLQAKARALKVSSRPQPVTAPKYTALPDTLLSL